MMLQRLLCASIRTLCLDYGFDMHYFITVIMANQDAMWKDRHHGSIRTYEHTSLLGKKKPQPCD